MECECESDGDLREQYCSPRVAELRGEAKGLLPIKGRITVFTITGCSHCKRVKSYLDQHKLPFVEINLDHHPQRRQELFELTKKKTVPQVFFNEVHVGSADDVAESIKTGSFEEMISYVSTTEADSSAPELPSSGSSSPKSGGGSRKDSGDEVTCEPDQDYSIVRQMRHPVSGIKVSDRLYHFRKYRKCFVGKEATLWFMNNVPECKDSATKAIAFGNHLIDKHFFHHVTYDHPFENEYLFYRFLEDEETVALNAQSQSPCQPPEASDVSEDLRQLIVEIYDEFLSKDGTEVDYEGIKNSEGWKKYVRLTTELQRVDVYEMTRASKIAFFINIYNALVIHATVVSGAPQNMWQRAKFFNKNSYRIGGYCYSLNDIENGILRANRRGAGATSKPFGKNDPRQYVSLDKHEPRIHFALVCGAKSCPSIRTYSADNLEEGLNNATEQFFDSNNLKVEVESKKEVSLNSILKWYHVDFGATDEEMLSWIAKYAPSEKKTLLGKLIASGGYKIVYQKYDWDLNSKKR